MKNKLFTFNLSTLCALFAVLYVVFYVLLSDNLLHISISSIISFTDHTADKKHFIVLAVLPVYIAAMIFGAALLGFFMGSRLECLLSATKQKFFKSSSLSAKKSA